MAALVKARLLVAAIAEVAGNCHGHVHAARSIRGPWHAVDLPQRHPDVPNELVEWPLQCGLTGDHHIVEALAGFVQRTRSQRLSQPPADPIAYDR